MSQASSLALFAALLMAGSVVDARFTKLKEVCRSSGGFGLCVQSPFCCRAIHGEVFPTSKPLILDRGLPPTLRSAAEVTHGCSYGGSCCVLPEIEDVDCSVCGQKGNGDINKASTPAPGLRPASTTTPAPLLKKVVERIVDGSDAEPNEWCWQVAILNQTGLIGGGALISRNWIVTAAHVVAGLFLDEFILALGLYGFKHEEDSGDEVFYTTALNVLLHPGYDPSTHNNDIALIRIPDAPCNRDSVCPVCLGTPVTFDPLPETTLPGDTTTSTTTTTTEATTTYGYGEPDPVKLTFSFKDAINKVLELSQRRKNTRGKIVSGPDAPENPYADWVCFMTGWGSTGQLAVAPVLQEVHQQIIPWEECANEFRLLNVPTEKINKVEMEAFCTIDPDLTSGTCIGDGGGVLVCQDRATHEWRLQGVIILGLNMCAQGMENGPTVHTNVGFYSHWIMKTVHGQLPKGPDKDSGRKAYKVPECGNHVGPVCPEKAHGVTFA